MYWMTLVPTKFEGATSNRYGEAFTKNTLFDLDIGVRATQNAAQSPIHHVIYAPAKFEVAVSNGSG